MSRVKVINKSNCFRPPHPIQAVRQFNLRVKDGKKAFKTFELKKKEFFYYC